MRPFLGQKRQRYCSFYYEIAVPDLGRIVKKFGQRMNSFSETLVGTHSSKHLSTKTVANTEPNCKHLDKTFVLLPSVEAISGDQINVTELGDHARKKTSNDIIAEDGR